MASPGAQGLMGGGPCVSELSALRDLASLFTVGCAIWTGALARLASAWDSAHAV